MRPLLKIGPLTQLQDARSAAAVGFDLISFSLARGDARKLPVSLAWNMAQWLSGPEIVLELNAGSLAEWAEAQQQIPGCRALMPLAEAEQALAAGLPGLILQAAGPVSAADMARWQQAGAWVEMPAADAAAAAAYESVRDGLILHWASLDEAARFVASSPWQPAAHAFSHAAEESPGQLDYARLDSWLEEFFGRFPQSAPDA
ncbi:MAG: hypothetical protein NW241_09405 [Bacteroidia bacterium]|nr:hypothetical protein [Bacteroidia bacterium]